MKADRLESGDGAAAESIRHIVHRVNDYVRQAIASLRFAPAAQSLPWTEMLHRLFAEAEDNGLDVRVEWRLPEANLSVREKVELYACLREALANVQKHADARAAFVRSEATDGGWTCSVADDGRGRYGLSIVRERAAAMGWRFALERQAGRTIFTIRKE